jgi:hypothetical protein
MLEVTMISSVGSAPAPWAPAMAGSQAEPATVTAANVRQFRWNAMTAL